MDKNNIKIFIGIAIGMLIGSKLAMIAYKLLK